jgi:6,7-dimethyl-8-ribityllumazine synthase
VTSEGRPSFEGTTEGAGRRIAIVAARFNGHVVEKLLDGATERLREAGVEDEHVLVAWVPGAFELGLAAKTLAAGGRHDAVICLGAVIRGDTAHFEYVCQAATEGVLRAGLDTGVPVIFGVLTTDTREQALARAGGEHGNKGADAALTALEMVSLLERLGKDAGA